jgi:hypothetical protein
MYARVPRIKCSNCGVRLINVPWARTDSGFTLLFEAYIMKLAPSMPVQRISELVSEHDTRLRRLIHHHVMEAREQADHSDVKNVGVDETSSKRGRKDALSPLFFIDSNQLDLTGSPSRRYLFSHNQNVAIVTSVRCHR